VLLDYYSWCQQTGKPYDPFTSHAIQLEDLLAVAKAQNVKFQIGDILLIRSGYTAAYYEYEKSDPKKLDEAGSLHPTLAGVAQTEEMKSWLHDSYVSLGSLYVGFLKGEEGLMLEQVFCCCGWRRTSLGVLAAEAVGSGKSSPTAVFQTFKNLQLNCVEA
jgi:hypothetical protein